MWINILSKGVQLTTKVIHTCRKIDIFSVFRNSRIKDVTFSNIINPQNKSIFHMLNFFLQNLVRVWRMNCLSNVQYSNLTFLLLICSSNNREFAATIKRPFEVRYDPYTSSVDVLKSPRDVCDVINNVRDELTILMQVLVKLQAKFDNWSEEKNSLHFLIIKCCNVSLLFMSNAHYTIGLRSDFVDKNVR